MRFFPLCDEQQYIFKVNETFKSIPLKISFMIKLIKSFSPEELSCAVDKCIKTADVFGARCVIKDQCPYMEFLPYQKQDIDVFNFSNEEEYQAFYKRVIETKINNRDKLYYIFIFSIGGSCYHLHFSFNHLICDAISGMLIYENIQKILLNKNEEIKWHPFCDYLESMDSYHHSERYLIDKAFWEDRFLEISKCKPLFKGVDAHEASAKNLTFQTNKKLKEDALKYCAKNNISPPILIATVLANIINKITGCECFCFEIPIGNRLGKNQKFSLGDYEISHPYIFDFAKNNNIFELLESVKKQSIAYYKHKNFDWVTETYSDGYESKYGRYISQIIFSYFCYNKKSAFSIATLHHHSYETEILPMIMYISDYHDWQTMEFSYVYLRDYFTDLKVAGIHKDIETGIANIIEILKKREESVVDKANE
jgi:hypothetical protein